MGFPTPLSLKRIEIRNEFRRRSNTLLLQTAIINADRSLFSYAVNRAAAKTVPGMSVPAPSLSSADGIASKNVSFKRSHA